MYARQVGSVWNCTTFSARAARQQRPPLGVGDDVVGVDALVVQQQGDVAPHVVERLAGHRAPRPPPRRRRGSPSGRRCSADDRLGPLAADHLEAEVGQPLGEQALRRADEEDRLLEPAPLADEADLLAAVLGVVARGRPRGRRGGRATWRQHGQVGVDGDPAAQVAEVVVEARPRLVGDEVEVDVLAVGQPERAGRCARGSPRRARRWPAAASRPARPGPPARRCTARRADRCRAGPRRGRGGRPRTSSSSTMRGPHAVAALDLVDEGDGLAGELLRRRAQARRPGRAASGGGADRRRRRRSARRRRGRRAAGGRRRRGPPGARTGSAATRSASAGGP